MKINYSVNHNLFTHPALQDLKGKPLMVTWLIWCQILHLAWNTQSKTCDFRQVEFCNDLKISQNTARAAIKHLLEKGVIKLVSPYQKGEKSATYELTKSSIRIQQKQYQKSHKAVSRGDTVNNINNIIREEVTNVPSPNKNNGQPNLNSETKESWEL